MEQKHRLMGCPTWPNMISKASTLSCIGSNSADRTHRIVFLPGYEGSLDEEGVMPVVERGQAESEPPDQLPGQGVRLRDPHRPELVAPLVL